MKTLKRFAAPVLFAGLLCASTLHAEGVLYDDTAGATSGGDGIGGAFSELYDSFSSGATGGTLTGLKLLLEGDSASAGTLDVDLYSDNSTKPGTLIARLAAVNDSELSNSASLVNISLTSNPGLAPDTRYWIVLSGTTDDAWEWTDDTTGTGVANEYEGNNLQGVSTNNAGGPYQMEVTEGTSSAPEPATWLLSLGVGGCFCLVRRRRPRES